MQIERDLVAASTTPLVLAILAEGDSYGYALAKRVRELSGGELEWSEGMLYPLLHRLERQGWVATTWQRSETGRRRKYYSLTTGGREALIRQRQQWATVTSALAGVWAHLPASPATGLA